MAVHSPRMIEELLIRANRNQPTPIESYTLATSAAHDWHQVAVHDMLVIARCDEVVIEEEVRQGTYNIVLTVSTGLPLGAAYDGRRAAGWSSAGQFSLIPPQGPCNWTTGATGQACHFFLSPALFAEGLLALSDGDPARYNLPLLFNRTDPLVEQLCQTLRAEMYAPSGLGPLYIDSLCQTLALHLLRLGAAPLRAPRQSAEGRVPPAIRRAMEYIDAHLDQPVGLAELSVAAHISQATLCRQFRRAIGLAPHQYLLRRRIERATYLLRTGTCSVTQAAHMSGFVDQGHLARWMRRIIGVAPRELIPSTRRTDS